MIFYVLFSLVNMVQNQKQIDKKIGNTSSVNMKEAVRIRVIQKLGHRKIFTNKYKTFFLFFKLFYYLALSHRVFKKNVIGINCIIHQEKN